MARAISILLGIPVLCISYVAAEAHSFLVESIPAAKEHVMPPVKSVKLVFGGGAESAHSKISVEAADGKLVAEGGKPGAECELLPDKP